MKTKDEQISILKNRVNRMVQEKGIDGNTILSWQKECLELKKALRLALKLQGSRICTNIDAASGCNIQDRDCRTSECHNRMIGMLIEEAKKSGTSAVKDTKK